MVPLKYNLLAVYFKYVNVNACDLRVLKALNSVFVAVQKSEIFFFIAYLAIFGQRASEGVKQMEEAEILDKVAAYDLHCK